MCALNNRLDCSVAVHNTYRGVLGFPESETVDHVLPDGHGRYPGTRQYHRLETFRLGDWDYAIRSIRWLWSVLPVRQKPAMMKRCLERSVGCALDVYGLEGRPNPRLAKEFTERMLRQTHRIRLLSLKINGFNRDTVLSIFALLASLPPALVELSISHSALPGHHITLFTILLHR